MPTVNVVFGKSTKPAKFYHKGKRISVDTAFGMYQKKARFVVDGKALNVNRFGAQWPCPEGKTWNAPSKRCVKDDGKMGKGIRKAQATKIQKMVRRRKANSPVELSECPVCMEDRVLVKPYECADRGIDHGVCESCASRIARTTKNCPMCRAPPKDAPPAQPEDVGLLRAYYVTDEHQVLYNQSQRVRGVLAQIFRQVSSGNARQRQEWQDFFTTFRTNTSNAANQIRHWMQVGDTYPTYTHILEEFETPMEVNVDGNLHRF